MLENPLNGAVGSRNPPRPQPTFPPTPRALGLQPRVPACSRRHSFATVLAASTICLPAPRGSHFQRPPRALGLLPRSACLSPEALLFDGSRCLHGVVARSGSCLDLLACSQTHSFSMVLAASTVLSRARASRALASASACLPALHSFSPALAASSVLSRALRLTFDRRCGPGQ